MVLSLLQKWESTPSTPPTVRPPVAATRQDDDGEAAEGAAGAKKKKKKKKALHMLVGNRSLTDKQQEANSRITVNHFYGSSAAPKLYSNNSGLHAMFCDSVQDVAPSSFVHASVNIAFLWMTRSRTACRADRSCHLCHNAEPGSKLLT